MRPPPTFIRRRNSVASAPQRESKVRRVRWLAPVLLIGALGFAPLAVVQSLSSGLDFVLIIDTSKSMRGKGGPADIFDRVKRICKELVSEMVLGESVTLVRFDQDVQVFPAVTLHSETERERVLGLIDALEAEGDRTYLAKALETGLSEAAHQEAIFAGHRQVVLILTDGINDPPAEARGKGPTMEEVARPYKGKPWFVFQVQLGELVDDSLARAIKDAFKGGGTIHDPRGARLREVRGSIMEAARRPVLEWKIQPAEFELTVERLGATDSARSMLEVPVDLALDAIEVALDRGDIPETVAVHASLARDRSGAARATVTATAAGYLKNGTYRGVVRLRLLEDRTRYEATPTEIPVTVKTALAPATWPYWLLGTAVAIGAVLAVIGVSRWRRSRRLFGSLEYWPLGRPSDVQAVELAPLGTTTGIIGGKSIPIPGADHDLAMLVTRKVDGEMHVVVVSSGSAITHDGREAVEIPLYDGDEFELGGWHFVYRGEVSRRPVDV